MVPAQSGLEINDCPTEVLEHIFGFLPFSDRKSASLVCRTWCELAFSRRYMRHIVLRLIDWDHSQSYKYVVLKRSSRSYRNLFAFFGPDQCTEVDFDLVVTVFDLFGTTLESFHCLTYFSTSQLRQILRRTPNIQQLIVGVIADTVSDEGGIPMLRYLNDLGSLNNILQISELNIVSAAPNVRQLSVNFTGCDDPVKSLHALHQYAPNLKILELFSSHYILHIDELRFPQLEVLKLSGKICSSSDSVQRTFFKNVSGLKEVTLNCEIGPFVLDLIANSCTKLKTLHIRIETLGENAFRCLERLKQLKDLSLLGTIRLEMLTDCKPLVSVEQLHLELYDIEDSKAICDRLSQILPNLREMKVTLVEQSNLDECLYQLFNNFTRLKRLSISDRGVRFTTMSLKSFDALDQLKELEELTLKSLNLPVTSLFPSCTLKRLKFKYFHSMSNRDLLSIARNYPNLRYFEVNWCRMVTRDGIQAVRLRMPNCVVHYLP